jgi:hypothetical protein
MPSSALMMVLLPEFLSKLIGLSADITRYISAIPGGLPADVFVLNITDPGTDR